MVVIYKLGIDQVTALFYNKNDATSSGAWWRPPVGTLSKQENYNKNNNNLFLMVDVNCAFWELVSQGDSTIRVLQSDCFDPSNRLNRFIGVSTSKFPSATWTTWQKAVQPCRIQIVVFYLWSTTLIHSPLHWWWIAQSCPVSWYSLSAGAAWDYSWCTPRRISWPLSDGRAGNRRD